MAFGQLLTGMGVGVGYGVLSEYARLGLLWAKWKLIPTDWKRDAIASTLQNILNVEHDKVSGLSTKGAVDVISNFIDKTIDLAWMCDESIAIQMFIQMIQQSIAYAIHASHAGSIGTIANVYSGSQSLSVARAQAISEGMNEFDRKTRAFLDASVGANIPTLTSEVVKGVNARLEDYLRRIIADGESLIGDWNDLVMGYYRRYTTLAHQRYQNAITMKEDVVTRAYSLLETIGHEHLRRINELSDTLDGAYNWYSAGLISISELSEMALRIDLERQASELVYDEYKTSVLSGITDALVNWDSKITQAYGDLTDMETEWRALILNALAPVINDVTFFVDSVVTLANQAIEDVSAYRNIEPALRIVSTGTFEHFSPETIGYVFTEGTASPYNIYYDFIGGTKVLVDTSEDDFATYAGSQRKLVLNHKTGILHVVYFKQLSGKYQIYTKKSVDGGLSWVDATRISTLSGMENYDHFHPSIAIDSDGVLHVVWCGYSTAYPTQMQIWYTKYDGTWSTPIRLNTYANMGTLNQFDPCITIDSLDKLHVVWYGGATGYSNPQIWYVKFDGVSWSSPLRISTVSGMENYWQELPSITVDSADKLHVVWHGCSTSYPDYEQIWYAKYDGSWLTPIRLSTYSDMDVNYQYSPCITVDSKDALHVIWSGEVSAYIQYQIWYAKHDGGVWSTPIRISTASGMDVNPQEEPSIMVTGEDEVVALWQGMASGYTDYDKIWMAKYVTSWSIPQILQSLGRNTYVNVRWSKLHQR